MKQSITYLPTKKQDDLNDIVKLIREKLPQAEIIILYGSYARNEYVDFDQRTEFGITTTFRSDYDILVVTHGISTADAAHKLDNVEDIYYKDPETQTPLSFINDDIKQFNKDLEEGRYFYTQLQQEGIILYNSEKFKLAQKRELNYSEIKQQAEEYFNEKYQTAIEFFDHTKFDYERGRYKMSSFDIHQTCENLIYAVKLVFTLQNPRQHNLSKLFASVKKYSPDFLKIFPCNTEEEKRIFNIAKLAYVQARYNPEFVVTKHDIDLLMPKVEQLFELVKRICEQQIKEYGEMK